MARKLTQLTPRGRPDRKELYMSGCVSLADRVEKLESFNNTLTKDALELISHIESELNKGDDSFKEEKVQEELLELCRNIRAFCVLNRPAKTWTNEKT